MGQAGNRASIEKLRRNLNFRAIEAVRKRENFKLMAYLATAAADAKIINRVCPSLKAACLSARDFEIEGFGALLVLSIRSDT